MIFFLLYLFSFFFYQEDVKLPCIACLGVLEKNQEKSFIDKVSLPKLWQKSVHRQLSILISIKCRRDKQN